MNNFTNRNSKLVFLAIASTVILAKGMHENDKPIHAMSEEELTAYIESVSPTLTFDSEGNNLYLSQLTQDELFENARLMEEELQRLKKLEEERLEALKTYIYVNTNNLLQASNVTVEHLRPILAGTGLEGTESAYIDAEKTYGVNALFIMAITVHESGWGTSWLSQNKNNVTGYQAYPGKEREARYFDSKYDCIMRTAKLIAEEYLNPNGKYHNGYSIESVNIKYCVDGNGSVMYSWSDGLKRLMKDFSTNLVSISEDIKVEEEAVTYVYFNDQQL